ncbi:class I SAM-dependent methyltransferase [Streptomyces sp. RS10V-4]|uniref:class I SAM-dependent methyltransferase n=1 Tax=Streptomyces rhizoryzae TaxID=2932493 RepID=UPI0020035A50|nr:class I SAM-dependent methyltransferase [Streptomyces rhizoryzae]MCK7625252.1 class I SAM-dependent methyltransferase [Streptomyces rhizoryzae]
MPFNHNDHYHALLLRELPADCRRALDVGCGTGAFARAVASRGIEVDAIDTDGEVIAAARRPADRPAPAAEPRFRQLDIARVSLPPGSYDYISCLASLHHVPFETVRKLREALTDGGVLVVLGCYRETTPADFLVGLAAAPVNAAYRSAAFVRERLTGAGEGPPPAPVADPVMPLAAIRKRAAAELPRCRVRRLLFWRYLLVYRNGG